MKKFKEALSLRRGSISLAVLILSLLLFFEALAAAGDIFLPIVYQDIKPTVTPTATPTLIPGGVVVLNNHTAYTTTTGQLHLVGEVKNNTTYTLRNVKVTVNFYNASNQLLKSSYTFTHMIDLPTGNSACFRIVADEPTGWSKYEFEPVTYWTDGDPLPELTTSNVRLTYNSQFKYYSLTGSVRNQEGVHVFGVKPVGTLYDKSTKKVIGCKFYQFLGPLAPGASGLFNIEFRDRIYTGSDDYDLQVDGDIP